MNTVHFFLQRIFPIQGLTHISCTEADIGKIQIETTMRYYLTPIRIGYQEKKKRKKKEKITSVGKEMEKQEPSALLVGK